MGFLRSVYYALCGVKAAFKERNFRVQCVAVLFVLTLAPVLSNTANGSVRLAALIICCGLVPAFELVNSAVERLCDLITKERKPEIKYIKDISAGAVFIMALASAMLFAVFIYDGGLCAIIGFSKTHVWYPALLFAELLLLIPAFITKNKG